jgi:hypothetical protein
VVLLWAVAIAPLPPPPHAIVTVTTRSPTVLIIARL